MALRLSEDQRRKALESVYESIARQVHGCFAEDVALAAALTEP
jgi:hypothetical protein